MNAQVDVGQVVFGVFALLVIGVFAFALLAGVLHDLRSWKYEDEVRRLHASKVKGRAEAAAPEGGPGEHGA